MKLLLIILLVPAGIFAAQAAAPKYPLSIEYCKAVAAAKNGYVFYSGCYDRTKISMEERETQLARAKKMLAGDTTLSESQKIQCEINLSDAEDTIKMHKEFLAKNLKSTDAKAK